MVADCILAKAEQSRTLRMLCTKDYGHTNSLQPTFKYQSHIQTVHRLHGFLTTRFSKQHGLFW